MLHKFIRLIALIFAILLSVICAFSATTAVNIPTAQTRPDAEVVGVLNLTHGNPVSIKGNPVGEGMTILSGMEIKTYKSKAAISLGELGGVELGLNTTIKLIYGKDRVELSLVSGQASLTTLKGVAGSLIISPGETLQTDSSVPMSTVRSSGETGTDTTGDARPNGSFLGLGTVIALTIEAARGVMTIISNQGNDPEVSGQIRP